MVIALLAGLGFGQVLRGRLRYGPGLFFADVELFAAIAVICGAFGGLALFLGAKLDMR